MKIKPLLESTERKPTMSFGSVITATGAQTASFGGWGVRITTR